MQAISHPVAMLIVGALILLIVLAVDLHIDAKARARTAWWKKKRDGGGDAA